VEQVAEGVHRIPLPMPTDGLRAVNVYALTGPDGLVLIDGGWRIDPAREALESALAVLGAGVPDVRNCLVTHVHRDHYTLAVDLRARAGTSVGLGAGERRNLERVRSYRADRVTATEQRLLTAGATDLVRLSQAYRRADTLDLDDWQDPDVWLADGERLPVGGRELRVLATPGHTAGHVAYVDDDASLVFSGDHVLPHITPSIGFEPATVASPLADYLTSLARVLAQPDRVMLPAHGPAGGSVHRRVEQLVEHHRVRLDQTLAATGRCPGPALGIATVLRWTRHERSFDELDPFNQMLAVNETLAHLVVLHAQGRLVARDENGVLIFTGH
jgi:glyoxylase-like metal-dependent hydrolase (beta-lactamase superfamily II)